MRRVPVPLRGAGDAAPLLAQLLPGLRAGVPGLGRGRPPAAAAAAAGAGTGAGAGPPLPGGTRTGTGAGRGRWRRRGRRPGVVPAVQEAVPAAPRRRRRAARQHHAGGGGQALPVRRGRGRQGGGGRAGAGPWPALPAGARGNLPEASEPAGAAVLPHVPPGGVRAVRL